MFTKKNSKKLHTNLSKCQVENCPALPGRNLISTCNRRVRSVPAGRGEISSRQTGMMQSPTKKNIFNYCVHRSSVDYQKIDCSIISMGAMSYTIKWLLLKRMAFTKRNTQEASNDQFWTMLIILVNYISSTAISILICCVCLQLCLFPCWKMHYPEEITWK